MQVGISLTMAMALTLQVLSKTRFFTNFVFVVKLNIKHRTKQMVKLKKNIIVKELSSLLTALHKQLNRLAKCGCMGLEVGNGLSTH